MRFEGIPFDLPIKKEEITTLVKAATKCKRDVGECNCAINFKNGKGKAIILYLDTLNDTTKERLMKSKIIDKCYMEISMQTNTYVATLCSNIFTCFVERYVYHNDCTCWDYPRANNSISSQLT